MYSTAPSSVVCFINSGFYHKLCLHILGVKSSRCGAGCDGLQKKRKVSIIYGPQMFGRNCKWKLFEATGGFVLQYYLGMVCIEHLALGAFVHH